MGTPYLYIIPGVFFLMGIGAIVGLRSYTAWRKRLHEHGVLPFDANGSDYGMTMFKARRLLREAEGRRKEK